MWKKLSKTWSLFKNIPAIDWILQKLGVRPMIERFILLLTGKICDYIISFPRWLSEIFTVLITLFVSFLVIYFISITMKRRWEKASPIKGLSIEQGLRSTLGKFKENLASYRYSSAEIFKEYYADLSGDKYWRGWFTMPIMNMITFVDLLAIHKINENADAKKIEDRMIQISPTKIIGPYYNADIERKKVRIALRNAAQGGVSFFRSGQDILSNMKDDSLGEKYRLFPTLYRSFNEVKISPLEALDWFIKTSTYSDLIPESLYEWRNKQKM
jgi:hypothetical protein